MKQQLPKNIAPVDLNGWLKKRTDTPILVDVREEDELRLAKLPFPIIHLPLSKAHIWQETFHLQLSPNNSIVVICHSGIRSWNFCTWLISKNMDYEIWNLEGGIDSWSLNVDPSIPRY